MSDRNYILLIVWFCIAVWEIARAYRERTKVYREMSESWLTITKQMIDMNKDMSVKLMAQMKSTDESSTSEVLQ